MQSALDTSRAHVDSDSQPASVTSMDRPEPDYISTRRFGDAAVTVFNEASGLWPLDLVGRDGEPIAEVPGAGEDGRVMIGFHVVHIQTAEASILVDAGFDDPVSAWGKAVRDGVANREPNAWVDGRACENRRGSG